MQGADGGQLQGYNAELAVSADGLILSPELVQDCNDRRQLQPMSRAAVQAARLVHQARCTGGCPLGDAASRARCLPRAKARTR